MNINPEQAKKLSNKCTKTERLKNWEIVVGELDVSLTFLTHFARKSASELTKRPCN